MSLAQLVLHDREHNHLTVQTLDGFRASDLGANDIRGALAEVRSLPEFEPGRHVALIVIPGGKTK